MERNKFEDVTTFQYFPLPIILNRIQFRYILDASGSKAKTLELKTWRKLSPRQRLVSVSTNGCITALVSSQSFFQFQPRRTDVITESLDNTAPVAKIMSFLDSRQKMVKVYKYVSCLTRQQRRGQSLHIVEHFTVAGQPLNAYNDDWDGGLPSGYFENLSHKSMLPRMITEPRHIGKEDPVTELLHAKHKWNRKTMMFKSNSKSFSSDCMKGASLIL